MENDAGARGRWLGLWRADARCGRIGRGRRRGANCAGRVAGCWHGGGFRFYGRGHSQAASAMHRLSTASAAPIAHLPRSPSRPSPAVVHCSLRLVASG